MHGTLESIIQNGPCIRHTAFGDKNSMMPNASYARANAITSTQIPQVREEVIERLVPLFGLVHVARMPSVRYLVFSWVGVVLQVWREAIPIFVVFLINY